MGLEMDILDRIDFLLADEIGMAGGMMTPRMDIGGSGATITANVAKNLAKGHVDIVGGKCPEGQVYDTKKKVCVPVSKVKEQANGKAWDTFLDSVNNGGVTNSAPPNGTNGNGMSNGENGETNGKVHRPVGFAYYMKYGKKKKKCPEGMEYDKDLNICVPKRFIKMKTESSVVGGSYVGGTTVNIIGSGQTRVWGEKFNWITDLDRKEPVEVDYADQSQENMVGRLATKFSTLLGHYQPKKDTVIDTSQEED